MLYKVKWETLPTIHKKSKELFDEAMTNGICGSKRH